MYWPLSTDRAALQCAATDAQAPHSARIRSHIPASDFNPLRNQRIRFQLPEIFGSDLESADSAMGLESLISYGDGLARVIPDRRFRAP